MQITKVTVEACDLGRDFRWGGRRVPWTWRRYCLPSKVTRASRDRRSRGRATCRFAPRSWPSKKPPHRSSSARTPSTGRGSSRRCGARSGSGCRYRSSDRGCRAVGPRCPRRGPLHRGHARPPSRPHPGLRERPARRYRRRLRGHGGRAGGRRIPAIKLHVCGDLDTDTAASRAARQAAGDDVDLMMDAMAVYDRHAARSLGYVPRRPRLPLVRGPAPGRRPGGGGGSCGA